MEGMSADTARVDAILRARTPDAVEQLMPLIYDELKRIAHHHLRMNGSRTTLCTTELVHEAFLKLTGGTETTWQSRAHLFGTASRAMRQVLVDFARRRSAAKRGGELERVSLRDSDSALELELDEILALDAALEQLDLLDPRLRKVVELRFFGGVPEQDIARMLDVSPRTVERDWLKARLFLLEKLDRT